jgi:hypothetical protein
MIRTSHEQIVARVLSKWVEALVGKELPVGGVVSGALEILGVKTLELQAAMRADELPNVFFGLL